MHALLNFQFQVFCGIHQEDGCVIPWSDIHLGIGGFTADLQISVS